MTTQEAIDELIYLVGYNIEEIEQYEEFPDDMDEEMNEINKKHLEAYITIFGQLDPSLSTIEGIKERIEKVKEESGEVDEEPSEIETELFNLLDPWYKKAVKENGGYGTQLELTEEESNELIDIMAENPEEVDDEDRCIFGFYPYKGRVCVIFMESDMDFSGFSKEFQEKSSELIKKHLEG